MFLPYRVLKRLRAFRIICFPVFQPSAAVESFQIPDRLFAQIDLRLMAVQMPCPL